MKKIISLLLILAMLIFVFASCGNNKNGNESSSEATSGDEIKDGEKPSPALTKAEILEALFNDLVSSGQKLASASKLTFTLTNTVEVPFDENETMEIDTTATVVKNGDNFHIYGDLGNLGGDENGPFDFSFDFVYVRETLYVNLPIADVQMYFPNVKAADFEEAINIVIGILDEAYDMDTEQVVANAIKAITDGVLVDAIKKVNFSDCKNFEAVVEKALRQFIPIVSFVYYGEGWEDNMKEYYEDFDQYIAFMMEQIFGDDGIPDEVLDILNSNVVMSFIKSDLAKYLEVAKETNASGVTTYSVGINSEFFNDVAKIINAFAKFANEEVTISINATETLFTLKVDSKKNINELSLKCGIKVSVNDTPVAMGNVDFKASATQSATSILEPSDYKIYDLGDKDALLDYIEEIVDGFINGRHSEAPGKDPDTRGELDDFVFVIDDIGIKLPAPLIERIFSEGIDEEDFINVLKESLYQEYPKAFDFRGMDYIYNGDGEIYVDGDFYAMFDGNRLTIAFERELYYNDTSTVYIIDVRIWYVVNGQQDYPDYPQQDDKPDIKPDDNAFDDLKFVLNSFDIQLSEALLEELESLGMTKDDLIQQMFHDEYEYLSNTLFDTNELFGYTYYFDGYNIFVDDQLVAQFDGVFLILSPIELEEGVHMLITFEVRKVNDHALDGLSFSFSHVDVDFNDGFLELLDEQGMTPEEFTSSLEEALIQRNGQTLVFDGMDYYFDGYNIYIENRLAAYFDGYYLFMTDTESSGGVSFTATIYFVVN